MKHNQKGFGLIEGLVLLVVLGLLIGVGLYVLGRDKQTDVSKSSNVTSTMTIKEYGPSGVTITLPKILTGLKYDYYEGGTIELTSPGYQKVIDKCYGVEGNPAFIATVSTKDGTFEASGADDDPVLFKQFANFYLVGSQGSAFELDSCSSGEVDKDYKVQQREIYFKALQDAFKTATQN